MFEDALRFPWQGEKNIETLLIGGLMTLLGVFFIPLLFVYGYAVRVIRRTAAGEVDVPPAFDEWSDLFVDGLAGFVISLVYIGVPTALVSLAVVLFFVPVSVVSSGATDTGSGIVASGGVVIALLLVLLSAVLVVAALYLTPAAVAAYARTRRFGAAFSPSVLWPIVTDRRYATGWVVAFAIALLAQVLGGAVSATGVGAVLVPFISFYGTVAGAYAIGIGVRDVSTVEDGSDTKASQPAA